MLGSIETNLFMHLLGIMPTLETAITDQEPSNVIIDDRTFTDSAAPFTSISHPIRPSVGSPKTLSSDAVPLVGGVCSARFKITVVMTQKLCQNSVKLCHQNSEGIFGLLVSIALRL